MVLLPIFAFAAAQPEGDGAPPINVMPLPASVKVSPGKLKLDATFTVATGGYTDARLEQAIIRMQQRLRRRTGLALPVGAAPAGGVAKLMLSVKAAGEAYPKFGEDESYTLTIDASHATLQANTAVGAMRGMETLSQLVDGDASGYYFPLRQHSRQAALRLARTNDRRGPAL